MAIMRVVRAHPRSSDPFCGVVDNLPVMIMGPSGPQAGDPDGPPPPDGSAAGEDAPTAAPRRRRLLALAAAAAGLAVLLGLVVLVVQLPRSSPGRRDVRASALPAGTPLSREEYQQILTTLDRDLTPVVEAVAVVNTYVAASAAVDQLGIKVAADATVLDGIIAPPPVRVAHQHLVKAIHQLRADAALMADQAHKEIVCTGGSTLAETRPEQRRSLAARGREGTGYR